MSDNIGHLPSHRTLVTREDINQQYCDSAWASMVPTEGKGFSRFDDQTQAAPLFPFSARDGEFNAGMGHGKILDDGPPSRPPFYEPIVHTSDLDKSMRVEHSSDRSSSPIFNYGKTSQLSTPYDRPETIGMPANMESLLKEGVTHWTTHVPKKQWKNQEGTRQKGANKPKTYLADSNDVGAAIAHVSSLFPNRHGGPETTVYPPALLERDLIAQDGDGAESDGNEWDDCDRSLGKNQRPV